MQSALANSDLKKSPIFIILNKNVIKKNFKHKINNDIKLSYYDSVLDQTIYGSANGLKKNSFLNKDQATKYVLTRDQNLFVSYFYSLSDDFGRFKIYPRTYVKDYLNSFFNKNSLLYNYYSNKENQRKPKLNSNSYQNLRSFNDLNLSNKKQNINSIIFSKIFYKNLTFITDSGSVLKFPKEFFNKSIFTGLIRILPTEGKHSFRNLLIVNGLLISYTKNLINKNINLKDTHKIILYFSLSNFFLKRFNSILNNKNIKIRKSNIFLNRYKNILNPFLIKFNNFFLRLFINKIQKQNDLFYSKNNLALNNKILLFKLLRTKLYTNNVNHSYFLNENNIFTYKNFIINNFILSNNNLNLFSINPQLFKESKRFFVDISKYNKLNSKKNIDISFIGIKMLLNNFKEVKFSYYKNNDIFLSIWLNDYLLNTTRFKNNLFNYHYYYIKKLSKKRKMKFLKKIEDKRLKLIKRYKNEYINFDLENSLTKLIKKQTNYE